MSSVALIDSPFQPLDRYRPIVSRPPCPGTSLAPDLCTHRMWFHCDAATFVRVEGRAFDVRLFCMQFSCNPPAFACEIVHCSRSCWSPVAAGQRLAHGSVDDSSRWHSAFRDGFGSVSVRSHTLGDSRRVPTHLFRDLLVGFFLTQEFH